ncbi:MAG: response regulator [Arcobacteraceae bacterium]|nr:response regulator [Arcobacteraceae bacterium]
MDNIELIKKLKVLYVEDEIILRDITCKSLASVVKEIVVADDGQEGLDKFIQARDDDNFTKESKAFDLIITDLAMPIMDGLEMIEKIREIDNDIPILVTTAYGSQNKEVASLSKIGMNAYVMKPVDVMDLVKTIDKLINKSIN